MTWKTYLNETELMELSTAQKARDDKTDAYNATREKLKNRAKARMRSARAKQRKEAGE